MGIITHMSNKQADFFIFFQTKEILREKKICPCIPLQKHTFLFPYFYPFIPVFSFLYEFGTNDVLSHKFLFLLSKLSVVFFQFMFYFNLFFASSFFSSRVFGRITFRRTAMIVARTTGDLPKIVVTHVGKLASAAVA